MNEKLLTYKNILIDWFNSEDLDLNQLRVILDIRIPLDTGNSELNILLNSMGWWFDRIETYSKSQLRKDSDFKKYHKKLLNFKG